LGRSAPQCGNSWVAESSKRTRRKRTAEAFVLGPEFGNLHLRRFKLVRGQTLGATTSCSPFGLLGVPALRPPLCSPGLDPRGMFATFATFSVRPLIFLHNHPIYVCYFSKRKRIASVNQSCGAPTVSAIVAPRAPRDFGLPVVVSRTVWCSVSALRSAPINTTMIGSGST
jgi:hypothetical protein